MSISSSPSRSMVSIVLDHPALGLLDVGRDRGLAERLGDDALEELVARLHPAPPLGDDRELEAAGVLVELADQRVHAAGVEGRAAQAVERGEDPDVGRVAAEGAAAHLGELLDVVGADVARARLEGHDVAQIRRRDLLGHHPDERAVAVGDRRDDAIGDGDRGGDERRLEAGVERAQRHADDDADHEAERELQRAQAEQAEQRAADDRRSAGRGRRRRQAQQPAEQRHEQGAGEDALRAAA